MAVYSDINGFPEAGFPVLSDVSDRVCLNTLYWNPLKEAGFILDVVGNNRLAGNLSLAGMLSGVTSITMNGALSGVSTITANGTATLTSGNPLSLTDVNANIRMPGLNSSIGSVLERVYKGYFKNLDVANTLTVNGNDVALIGDIKRYVSGTLNTLPKYNATGITDSKFTDDGTTPKYNANTIYHSGIANLSTVDWSAKDFVAATAKIGSLSGYLKGTAGVVGAVSSIPQADIDGLLTDLSGKLSLDGGVMNNTNRVTNLNADLLHGHSMVDAGNNFGGITYIGNDGVMEVGKYLDFHNSDTAINDYDNRLYSGELGTLYLNGSVIWHSGNDGAGSGLDSDMIEGYHISSIMASKRLLLNNENLDDLKEIGSYVNTTGNGTGNSNFPNIYGIIDVIGDGSNYGSIQRNYNADNGELSHRFNWGGWQPWRKVWDDKNSNLSTVDWSAKDLTVTTAKIGSLSGYLKGTAGVVGAVSSIPESDITPTAYATLAVTSNATTWDCSTGLNKRVTISANIALTMTNLVDGMSGDLVVNVSSISTITITTTGFTQKKYGSLTSKPVGKYHLCWICEGTNIDFNITDTPYA